VNPFELPPAAALLEGLARLVLDLTALFAPWAGASAAAAAVVGLTLGVRLVLLPVAVSQVKAEVARYRLAPAIAEIRRRHSGDPVRIAEETQRLHRDEGVSPLAGVGLSLLQLPVVSAVYALFTHATIAGHANALLSHTLFGAVLGANVVAALPHVLVPLAVLAALTVVVEATRRATARWHVVDSGSAGAAARRLARVLPFVTVLFAAVAPLAAALFLLTSGAWALGERELLRRRLFGREGVVPATA
jgi:YidC/Oxa1 family membrane protein insertase